MTFVPVAHPASAVVTLRDMVGDSASSSFGGVIFARADNDAIAGYSARALARVWKSERFSWSLTKLMHRFPEDGPFERAMQVAELDYIASSVAARTAIAENYVGLPV